jgi:hypothetical protein
MLWYGALSGLGELQKYFFVVELGDEFYVEFLYFLCFGDVDVSGFVGVV